MLRICHIFNLLLAGGIKLHSILINVFAIEGLGRRYAPVNNEFALSRSLFTSLEMEGIVINRATYTSTVAVIADEPDTYASTAGKAHGPPAPTPQPTTAPTPPGVSTFPPSNPPPGRKFTALMEKAATACPLCHKKNHGLIKCGYGLRAGYVTKHNLEKAKTQIKALDLGKVFRIKPGKNP